MTINLSDSREQFVRSLVQGGRFASEADVIEEAFRLLEQQNSPRHAAKQRQRPGVKSLVEQASPLPPDELNWRLLAEGLISQLPDPSQDIDDADDLPIKIEGEPLSATIIRERR